MPYSAPFSYWQTFKNRDSFEQIMVQPCDGGTKIENVRVGVRWGLVWLEIEEGTPNKYLRSYLKHIEPAITDGG